MGKLVELALFRGVAGILALAVFLPVTIVALGYLTYIVVESIRELKKEP